MEDEVVVKIGEKIMSRRHYLNLKQEDVAEMAGITIKTLYQIERGKGNPSLGTLVSILHVLGIALCLTIRTTNDERVSI